MAKGKPEPDRPVAGYFRISQARDEMIAPDLYEKKIRDYCKYKNLRLHEPIFQDVGVSGRAEARHLRKGLDALIERRFEFAAVVTPRLNRFGRSLKDLTDLFSIFDKDEIGLIFLDLDIDTRTSTGRLVRNVMASLAEWESDRISETWEGVTDNAIDNGRVQGAIQTPYGYYYDAVARKNIVVDPETAPIAEEVFRRFATGESVRSITKDMYARGIRFVRRTRAKDPTTGEEIWKPIGSSKEGKWTPSTVTRMIDNPAYVGRGRFDRNARRRKREGDLEARKAIPVDWQEYDGAWDPIIDQETWAKVRAIRAEMKGKPPRQGKGKYLLSGILVCGNCEANLHHVPTKGNRAAFYACTLTKNRDFGDACKAGSIDKNRAEAFVLSEFFRRVTPDRLRKALDDLEAQKVDAHQTTADLDKRLSDLQRRMAKLVELKVDAGPAELDAIQSKTVSVEQDIALLQQERAEVAHIEGQQRREIEDTMAFVATLAKEMPELWDDATTYENVTVREVIERDTEGGEHRTFQPEGTFADDQLQAKFEAMPAWHNASVEERRAILRLAIGRVVMIPAPPDRQGDKTFRKELQIEWRSWMNGVHD